MSDVPKSTLAARPLRILGLSLVIGIALGVVGGWVYALLSDKVVMYGIGTAWLLIGLAAFSLGLMGALEPAGGWATRGRQGPEWSRVDEASRRSLMGRAAQEATDDKVSSWALALWAVVVGGGLIALATFTLSVSG
jgi:hypothetical protein